MTGAMRQEPCGKNGPAFRFERRCGLGLSAMALTLALTTGVAWSQVGEADRITPAAFRQPDGTATTTQLTLAASVDVGDRLTTDQSGRVGIRLADDSRLTLGNNADVVINEFSYRGAADDRFDLSLGRGILRFVTGQMLPNGVEIATPSATLGIRGTDVIVAVAGAGTTRVTVLDGTILFQADNGRTAEVTAGNSAIFAPGLPDISLVGGIDEAISDPIIEFDDLAPTDVEDRDRDGNDPEDGAADDAHGDTGDDRPANEADGNDDVDADDRDDGRDDDNDDDDGGDDDDGSDDDGAENNDDDGDDDDDDD